MGPHSKDGYDHPVAGFTFSPSGRYAGDGLCLDDFSLRGALGTGGTSQVLLVQRKGTAGYYAMKVMPKAAKILRTP